jgi:hypothetical protein
MNFSFNIFTLISLYVCKLVYIICDSHYFSYSNFLFQKITPNQWVVANYADSYWFLYSNKNTLYGIVTH